MKKRVIVLSVFVVLSSALLASVPVLLCFLINSAIALNSDKVLIFIIAILSVLVSMMILKFLFNNLQYKYFNKEEVILKVRLFNGLNRGNIERLKTWPTSKFQQLFSTDIYNIIGIRIVTIPKLVKAISKIIFTLAAFLYMMIIHEVSFYVLIPVIILELILIPIGINYNKNALTHEKEYKDKLDFTDKYLAETGELITLIKGNSAYESSTEYYKKLNDDYLKVKNRTSSYLSLGRTTLYITSLIIFAVIVTLSAYLISLEYLTVGAMVFLILIVNNIHSSLLSPVPLLAQLNNYRTSMGRFIELENEKVKYNSLELKDFKAIVFDKVSFMYEGKTILNDVSFEIKQGEFVMLKGELGAG